MNTKQLPSPSTRALLVFAFAGFVLLQYVVISNYPHPAPGNDTVTYHSDSFLRFRGPVADRLLYTIGPVLLAPADPVLRWYTRSGAQPISGNVIGSWLLNSSRTKGTLNWFYLELAVLNTLVWSLAVSLLSRLVFARRRNRAEAA